MTDTKFCPHCKKTKPVTEFGKAKSRKNGLSCYCKTCNNPYRPLEEDAHKLKIYGAAPLGYRECLGCKETKEFALFYPARMDRKGRVTVSPRCRECTLKQTKERTDRIEARFANIVLPDRVECTKCKATKPTACFRVAKWRPGGLSLQCSDCTKADSKARTAQKKNDDVVAYKIKTMLISAKKRAKAADAPFDIDEEYLHTLWTGMCPVRKAPFNLESNVTSDDSPSLDRVISSRGYVKGNVRFLSHKANAMKNSGSLDDVLNLAAWLTTTYGEVRAELNL